MPLSIEQLTTPMSPEEVKTSIYNVLAAVGTKTTSFKAGAVVRTIIAACAVIISAFSELTALIAKSGFLELATAEWLTLVARYVFGVERTVASFAAGEVTLDNTGGGVFPMGIGDAIFKNSSTGRTYRNTSAFLLGALQTGLIVPVEAVEAGSASSSGAGEIDDFETPMSGVLVGNATALVGLDDESDPDLRTRCLEKRSALSPNGPRDAYAYFARQAVRAADGHNVGVTRVRVTKSSTTGMVTVTVANATGAVSGVANDPTTDLGAVDLNIKTNVVPDGVTETTQSAAPSVIPITYDVWVYSAISLTNAEIQALVQTKLATFMTTQPIGGNVIGVNPGKIFADAIRTTIGATRPEIFHVTLTLPAADVVLAGTDVPMLGTVIGTIHREAA